MGIALIQSNHIFDGAAKIGFTVCSEQDPVGANIFGEARECDALRARTRDRQRQLYRKSPSSSLFHAIFVKQLTMLEAPFPEVNRSRLERILRKY